MCLFNLFFLGISYQISSARHHNWRRVLCTWKLLSEFRSSFFMFIFYTTYKTWLYLYSTTVCWQRITQFIYTFLERWTENNAMFLFFYNLCWTVINTSYFLFSSGQASFAAVLLNMDLSAKYVIFILWLSV